jgi:hypothetical protein
VIKDIEIRTRGVEALISSLGLVEAARFIALINRERFDCTKWRQKNFVDETLDSLLEKIRRFERQSESGETIS